MMKFLRFLPVFILIACSSVEESDLEVDPPTEENNEVADSPLSLATNAVDNIQMVAQMGVEFPDEVLAEGTLVDGAIWNDVRGLNYLVIFQMKEGEFFSDGFKSELLAHHYIKEQSDGPITELWQVRDFGGAIYKTVDYQLHTLQVKDLDSDGMAETQFIYTITPDGLDEADVKLILHSKGEKLTISGKYTYGEDGLVVSDQVIDPAFKTFPVEFKSSAVSTFDSWIEEQSNRQ